MAGFGCSMGDIALVSNLAVSIYKSSKQAGKEFRSITQDVKSLYTSLHTLYKEIENPTSVVNRASSIQRGELTALMISCRADLEDIKKKFDGLQSLQKTKTRTWDRVQFSASTQAEVRSKVTRNTNRLNRFLNGLHTSAFEGLEEIAESHIRSVEELRDAVGRVEVNTQQHTQSFGEIALRLDKIRQDVLQRKRDPSILRDTASRAALEQEIMGENITKVDVEMNWSKISDWLENVRGTAPLQELFKDITNDPWSERSRVASPRSVPQAFPRRDESVRNNNDSDGEKQFSDSTQRPRAGKNSTYNIPKLYQATVEDYDSDDKEVEDRDMESEEANIHTGGKETAEDYASGEEGTEYYTAEDRDWETSDEEATQNDCSMKKSNQKRERYSSRDRRMDRSINHRPNSTPYRPGQDKDIPVHFDPDSCLVDLTGDSHTTVPSYYDSSDTDRVYETNKRTRSGVGIRSSHDVTEADFPEGDDEENQVAIDLQLTLFDIVERERIFMDVHGELLCVPLHSSVRHGSTIVYSSGSKSIHFLIKEKQIPSYEGGIFGDDIKYRAEIDLGEAFCGWRRLVLVPGDNGCRLIRCEGLSNSLWPITIPQCGMPRLADPSTRGDLIVQIDIMYPEHFSSKQEKQVAAILEDTTMKLGCNIA